MFKTKRTTILIFLIAVICILLAACSSAGQEEVTVSETKYTEIEPLEDEIIKIGLIHFPPFETVFDGVFGGPGIEITEEAFHRMGYTDDDFDFVEYPWSRVLELAKTGEIDIVLDLGTTEERETYLDFSNQPYANYDVHFMVPATSDLTYQGTIESLGDVVIGVVRDYKITDSYIDDRASGKYTFEDASNMEENLEKLFNERVPVILDSKYSVLSYLKESNRTDDIKILEPPYGSLKTFVGFSKANDLKELRDTYDITIQNMIDDGTVQKIYDKYFSSN